MLSGQAGPILAKLLIQYYRKYSIIDKIFSVSKVLLASCYIPFYAGLKFPQFKGQVWFIIVLIIITVHVL